MADIQTETNDKLRRTLTHEFVRMEQTFDTTRDHRTALVDRIMESAKRVVLTDAEGNTREDTDTGLRLITTALKALTDAEKADAQAIMLKLKQNEQSIASSAAARDRISIILEATKPGRIMETFPSESLQEQLEEMFDKDIKDFETKSSPRDLESD